MMNNTVQVSPRNRVDFSKIRKASQGIRIPKFQSPSGPIYNFDEFLNNLPTNQFKRGQTKFSIPWTPNWEGISGKYANVGELEANDKYKAFTDYVIQNAQGENADPRVLEYLKLLEQTTIDPNHAAILFDSNGNLNQNWANEYRRLRNDGKYGYYHLGPEGEPEVPPVVPEPEPEPEPEREPKQGPEPEPEPQLEPEEEVRVPGDYTPDEYHNFQFKHEPFLTPNPFIAGLGLAANEHQYHNEMLKKVPLLEAPYRQYITGAYKATVDAYNNAGAGIQSQANRIASQTSNLEQSQATQLQGAEMAANKQLEGALKQQEGYNQDRQKALETSWYNNAARTEIGNQNRTNLVADFNRKLDAKSKYQQVRNNIKSDFINKTWTDFQQWAANEKNERDSALASYNDYIAGLRNQKAMKPYSDLASDPMKSRSFATVYQNAFNDFNSNRGSDRTWQNANKELVNIFSNNELDQNAKNQAFMDYLRTSNSDYTTQFNRGYNSELTTAKNNFLTARQGIQNELASLWPSFRNTYIGGWGPWDTRHLGKQLAFEKNGGILRMKHGSRFVDYLEHNRKAIRDQKKTTMEVSKQMERELKTQLDSIDRETLILLRSIFK